MTLEGTHVVVVGMARSGVAAVELLLEKGAHVVAVDQTPKPNERLSALGIDVEFVCIAQGESVGGNPSWLKIPSGAYVWAGSVSGVTATVPPC